MAQKLKMTDKVELTLQQLRNLFIAGETFESNVIDVDMCEKDEVTEPDFDEYLKEVLDIEIID
jgi:hypothetical protein